jgi:hypothetical protein
MCEYSCDELRGFMKIYEKNIQTYAKALRDNDYETIITLFSQGAKVFSFQAGEQPALVFFQNLFANSSRSQVEIKNIFFSVKNPQTAAADLYLKVLWNKKHPIEFEAVDVFEFNSENKINTLKIILDTHPMRVLKGKYL